MSALPALAEAEVAFRRENPAYATTSHLDELRISDYGRLDRLGHVYLDYTGAGLYAESQISAHMALLNSHVYVPTQEGAILFDFTQWGWIHVIGGAFVALVGIVVMSTGATWARVLGVLAALLQAIGMVAFIQAYPFWTIATIALDVTVIYGLLVSPYRTQQV